MTNLSFFNLDLLNEVSAFLTAIVALIAMVVTGKQEWRRPSDMWARRVCLAVLAMVAMTHAFSPDRIPDVAQQLVYCALIIVITIGSTMRPEAQKRRQP